MQEQCASSIHAIQTDVPRPWPDAAIRITILDIASGVYQDVYLCEDCAAAVTDTIDEIAS